MLNSAVKHQIKLLFVLFMFYSGCSTISIYDYHSYETATSIKAETLSFLNNGTNSYSQFENEAVALTVRIDKAYEYEKGKAKNAESTLLWQKIKDPNGNLVGGYMKLWKEQGQLSASFIDEFKKNVEYAFNQIIKLEGAKIQE